MKLDFYMPLLRLSQDHEKGSIGGQKGGEDGEKEKEREGKEAFPCVELCPLEG